MRSRSPQAFWRDEARARDGIEFRGNYHRRVAEQEEEFVVSQLLPRRRRILEVGPGTGRFTRHLAKLSDELVVCDVNERLLEETRRRLDEEKGVRYVLGSLEEFGSTPRCGNFSAAVAMRVMPYIDDLADGLRRLVHSVDPGGIVIFDLWNSRSFEGWWQAGRAGKGPEPNFLSADDTRRMLAPLPLEIVNVYRWGYPRLGSASLDGLGAWLFPSWSFSSVYCCRRTAT